MCMDKVERQKRRRAITGPETTLIFRVRERRSLPAREAEARPKRRKGA